MLQHFAVAGELVYIVGNLKFHFDRAYILTDQLRLLFDASGFTISLTGPTQDLGGKLV
jgi:hypothetical protein